MDIYLDFPETQIEKEDWDSWRSRKLQALTKASKLIRAHPADVIQPVLVSKARVPVFKFIHSLTGISCDVTCMSNIGVHNSLLFRSIVDSDPRIRCLFFLVKLWAKRQRFQDLSSYALCLLVLFYLQKRDSILPSIESLQSGIPPLLIDGWNASFKPPVIHCGSLQLVDLLSGFFSYYRDYNSYDRVICPLIGNTIARSEFEGAGTTLPACMQFYVKHCILEENKKRFRLPPPLCTESVAVQDMFELNNNTTFNFGQWKSFRDECSRALENLSSGSIQHIFQMDEKRASNMAKKKELRGKMKACREETNVGGIRNPNRLAAFSCPKKWEMLKHVERNFPNTSKVTACFRCGDITHRASACAIQEAIGKQRGCVSQAMQPKNQRAGCYTRGGAYYSNSCKCHRSGP